MVKDRGDNPINYRGDNPINYSGDNSMLFTEVIKDRGNNPVNPCVRISCLLKRSRTGEIILSIHVEEYCVVHQSDQGQGNNPINSCRRTVCCSSK